MTVQFAFEFNNTPSPAAPRPRKRPAYRETSREAFREHQAVRGKVDKQILAAISEAGPAGITDDAIELKINVEHQTVSGNRRHLVEDGLVRHNGKFGLTRRGRKARLWIIKEHGEC